VRLLALRLVGQKALGDLSLPFAEPPAEDEAPEPPPVSVVLGAGGTGKSAVVAALASTRPGNTTALTLLRRAREEEPGFAVARYRIFAEDPTRESQLVLASPQATLEETDAESLARRRDQAAVDKLAQQGGFAFQTIPSVRWFSRTPVMLSAPDRAVFRHDARATPSIDDATRADLCRKTKQVLVFASVSAALLRDGDGRDPRGWLAFEATLIAALEALTPLTHHRFVGACPTTFEPLFLDVGSGAHVPFDDLPTSAKHLIAFVALPLRTLAAAVPERHPGQVEAVVTIDDAELHLPTASLPLLPGALHQALPRAQWILTTSAPELAEGVPPEARLVLRRLSPTAVFVLTAPQATVH
jgi:hypothetical protein